MLWQLLTNIESSLHIIITNTSELGKHPDSMQKFLFGESKAKELNFVGELAEKVSKAIQPQNTENSSGKNSGRGNSSSNTLGGYDHSSHSACSPPGNQGSQSFQKKKPYNNNRPFRRTPPRESLTWKGGEGTKGLLLDRCPTSSPCKLPTRTIHKRNRGKHFLLLSHLPFFPLLTSTSKKIPRAKRLRFLFQNWELLT